MAEYEPTTIDRDHAKYLREGNWRCTPLSPLPPSPTGAHHWIEVKADGVEPGTFVCKYCWINRKFPLSVYRKK